MRRYEAYPTIRTRAGLRPARPAARAAVLAGALIDRGAALFMLPWPLARRRGGSGSSPSTGWPVRAPVTPVSRNRCPAPTPRTYTIKSKDTLLKVAKMFGITLAELLAANPKIKNPDKIALGQQIIIPMPGVARRNPAARGRFCRANLTLAVGPPRLALGGGRNPIAARC